MEPLCCTAQGGGMFDELKSKSVVAAAQEPRSSTMKRDVCVLDRKESCGVFSVINKINKIRQYSLCKEM
jgi:hypothetical protein